MKDCKDLDFAKAFDIIDGYAEAFIQYEIRKQHWKYPTVAMKTALFGNSLPVEKNMSFQPSSDFKKK